MSEQEIINCIEQIQQLCKHMADGEANAKKEGRMMTVIEAKQMDVLSHELLYLIKSLPAKPCDVIHSDEQRQLASDVLNQAKAALKNILQPEPSASVAKGAAPRAVASRVSAYHSYQ
jgi:hypothetical protein